MENIMEDQELAEMEKPSTMAELFSITVKQFIKYSGWSFDSEADFTKAVYVIGNYLSFKYLTIIPCEPIMKELRRQIEVG